MDARSATAWTLPAFAWSAERLTTYYPDLRVAGAVREKHRYATIREIDSRSEMAPLIAQKDDVREFWNSDPCGTRYLDGKEDFAAHAHSRYSLEPHIFDFARFQSSRGLRVLEIGVGMGADYLEWLKAGAVATGVDLSAASIEKARQRCVLAGYQPDLRVADAESLPSDDDSFDVVYSYGVMHHSPDTAQ